MKMCIFADVHGNSIAWQSMYKREKDNVDAFYFLGDIFGYFHDQSTIIDDFIMDSRVHAIMGNHDDYYLRYFEKLTPAQLKSVDNIVDNVQDVESDLVNRYGSSYRQRYSNAQKKYISGLPIYLILESDGKRIGFFHGGPGDYLEQRIYPDTEMTADAVIDTYEELDYIFLGHTHYRMDRMKGQCRVINPGSLGQPRDGKGFSYGIFDTVTGEFEFKTVESEIDMLIKETSILDGDTAAYKYLTEKYKVGVN